MDTRKGSLCAVCKKDDNPFEAPEFDYTLVLTRAQPSRLPLDPKARRDALLMEAKVALMRREFGATEV